MLDTFILLAVLTNTGDLLHCEYCFWLQNCAIIKANEIYDIMYITMPIYLRLVLVDIRQIAGLI